MYVFLFAEVQTALDKHKEIVKVRDVKLEKWRVRMCACTSLVVCVGYWRVWSCVCVDCGEGAAGGH